MFVAEGDSGGVLLNIIGTYFILDKSSRGGRKQCGNDIRKWNFIFRDFESF